MDFNIEVIVGWAVAAVAFLGVVAKGYAKYIAPKTKTDKDDQVAGKIGEATDKVNDVVSK